SSGCCRSAPLPRPSIQHHGTDALAGVHQVEGSVDVIEGHGVGDEVVDIDLALHVPVDDPGHVGAAPGAAEGAAPPHPAGDQLERAGGNLLAGAGDADDAALAPALVAAFQGLAHHLDVADALEAVVHPAPGHLHDMIHQVLHLAGVDEIGHAELPGQGYLGGVQVDADDAGGPHHFRPLNHIEADAAEAKYRHGGTGLHLHGEG